jgi:hypothetical protein
MTIERVTIWSEETPAFEDLYPATIETVEHGDDGNRIITERRAQDVKITIIGREAFVAMMNHFNAVQAAAINTGKLH